MDHVRPSEIAAIALLAGQAVGILRMPFVEDRFFAWSPHDQRTDYRIEATHQGQPVRARDIQLRYQTPPVEWHSLGNIQTVIRTAEARKPASERWQVTLHYRVNLAPEQTWTWPTPAR